MMNVCTKCDEPRLYGNGETVWITKSWPKLKSVDHESEVRWQMSTWSMCGLRYGDPILYGNGQTDIITKPYNLTSNKPKLTLDSNIRGYNSALWRSYFIYGINIYMFKDYEVRA